MRKVLVLVLVLVLCMLSGCQKPPKTTLVLDYTPNTNHTGFYAAKDLGYYEKAGIDIEIIQPPEGGALSLIAGNKAQFAVSFQEELVTAITAESPLPVTAVAALLAHNTGGIMALKDKNIKSFKDLEGKSFGSWGVPIYDEIVFDCVRKDGGDLEKIEMIPNNATDSITGLQKEFDAVWVYEGWDKTIADVKGIESDFTAFRDVSPVFDYYTPIIAANENYTEKNKEAVTKFLEATKQGYEYAMQNPAESAKILLKYAPEVGEDVAIASQKYLKDKYYDTKWGEIDKTRWDNFNKWLIEKQIIKTDKEIIGYTNEYLK